MWGTIAIVAAGGVGVVLIARQAAAKKSGGSSACDAICTAAAAQGVPVDACKDGAAYQACQAANGVWDWLSNVFSGPDWAKMDADNLKLNGAIELPLGPLGDRTVNPITRGAGLHGTVLRFKNGGVPFKGFPGWEKCAKGTHDMLEGGTLLVLDPSTGKWSQLVASAAFTGGIGDPTRGGPFTADHIFHAPGVIGDGSYGASTSIGAPLAGNKDIAEAPFPLALDGNAQGYYAAGKPFTCPAGTSPQWNLRDQRTSGGPPPCVGPDGTGGWSSSGPSTNITQTGTTKNLGGCPVAAGYTYDKTAAGAWFIRRLAAGETQNQGPCAQKSLPTGTSSHYGAVAALIGE